MSTDEKDKIMAKLQKLIAKQESAEEIGNMQEAAAFAAKVNDLMMKYNIEQIEEKQKPGMEHESFSLAEEYGWNKSDSKWMVSLFTAIARNSLCDSVFTRTYKRDEHGMFKFTDNGRMVPDLEITIIGEKVNLEMVKFLGTQLISRLKYLCKKAWSEYEGGEKRNAFKRGYFAAAVSEIRWRLDRERVEQQKKYEGLTGLIKTNEVELRSKISELFPRMKVARRTSLSGLGGMAAGSKDGKSISIHKGVSGGNPGSRLLK